MNYYEALSYYYGARTKAGRKKYKHFLIRSRRAILDQTRKYSIRAFNIKSYIRGRDAGLIEGNFRKLPDSVLRQTEPITKKYTELIFAESQALVPIDKKYIGSYNPNDPTLAELKHPKNLDIPIMSKSDRADIIKHYREEGTGYYAQQIYYPTEYSKGYGKRFGRFVSETKNKKIDPLPSGYYVGEQGQFVKDFFLTTNKRKRYQLFANEEGMLSYGSTRYGDIKELGFSIFDVKPATKKTTKEMSGGNKELKRSGQIEKVGVGQYRISYDPTRLGAKWNYAQVQHDNLEYRHEVGQALYLRTAFDKYRDSYYKEIEEAIGKTIKERWRK